MLNNNRIDLVDALRGFALLAIVLLHNLEHYNLYFNPTDLPDWMKSLDGVVWNTTFFMMAGKAFSTFAMLFGFSFFIQFESAEKKQYDFRWRFVWRMVILIAISQVHSLFYNGDILLLYAIIGIMLTPLCKASNKTLLFVGIFLLLQPYEIIMMSYAFINPDFVMLNDLSWPYYDKMIEVMKTGTFTEALYSNITQGQIWNNLWQIDDGRFFKTSGLFVFGMLLGRMKYFIQSDKSEKFWHKTLLVNALAYIPLYLMKTELPALIESKTALSQFNVAISAYTNVAFMCILIACFTLIWFSAGNGYKLQRFIIPFGRMSLTNYVTQSLIGCYIYLNYGLGLYEKTGATLSILIGLTIFCAQLLFSQWWLSRHRQGPFETVWKKLTWINSAPKGK